MNVKVLREAGYKEAILGLSLSYGQRWSPADELKAYEVCSRLAHKGDGHNKFLESICVWLDVTAPRFFWSEFDTYRVGVTKQSESTMHTLKRDGMKVSDFGGFLTKEFVDIINEAANVPGISIANIKCLLPEGFHQRRIICTNYMALQRIIKQRHKHRLPQWRLFCEVVVSELMFPQFVMKKEEFLHDEQEVGCA